MKTEKSVRGKGELTSYSRRKLENYIKGNLSKGYSIEAIRTVLVEYGIEESLVNRIIRG